MEEKTLEQRIEALEAELAKAKEEAAAKAKPFVPKPMPKIDYTQGMSMGPSAVKPMADLINPRGLKYDPNHWRGGYPQPGGFGSPAKPGGGREPVKRGSGWRDPAKLEGMVTEEKMKWWSK